MELILTYMGIATRVTLIGYHQPHQGERVAIVRIEEGRHRGKELFVNPNRLREDSFAILSQG